MAYALADFNRACISGNVDAARQILASQPDFADKPDSHGFTPLLYLIHGQQNNVDVARLLLDSGAIDIEREYRGRGEDAHRTYNILGTLCTSKDLCNGNNDQRRGLISLLLSRGADASRVAAKPSGETPLHLTCAHQSSKGSALEWTGKDGTPEMKALFRKYLAMRVRRCVLGPASEHSRRQMARDLAPEIASFLV